MHQGSRLLFRVARPLALALLAWPLFLAHPGAAACDVRLNEICPAPGQDWDGNALFSARDDEWVEIVNTGDMVVDLSLYYLTDADSTMRWAGAGTLLPGEHRVVYGSDAVAWQQATGHPIAGLSLANAGDTIRLWQAQGTDTLVLESYTYDAHQAGTDRAIGRLPDGTGAFQLFDGLNPYTGALEPKGNGCNPTPRVANACANTPAGPSTWGRVKAQYR
jgi:hypothetical protein